MQPLLKMKVRMDSPLHTSPQVFELAQDARPEEYLGVPYLVHAGVHAEMGQQLPADLQVSS